MWHCLANILLHLRYNWLLYVLCIAMLCHVISFFFFQGKNTLSRKHFAASQIQLAPFCIALICCGIVCLSFFFSRKAHYHTIPKALHGNCLLLYLIDHTCCQSLFDLDIYSVNAINSIYLLNQCVFERTIKILLNPACWHSSSLMSADMTSVNIFTPRWKRPKYFPFLATTATGLHFPEFPWVAYHYYTTIFNFQSSLGGNPDQNIRNFCHIFGYVKLGFLHLSFVH